MIYLLAGAGVIISVALAFRRAVCRDDPPRAVDRSTVLARPDPSDASPDPIADLDPGEAIEPVETIEIVEPVEPVPVVPAGLRAFGAHSFGS